MNENQMHKDSCFVTLTYDDIELPHGENLPTLAPKDFELFMKRLRKEYGPNIKFFGCGEYGSRTNRPHYHACLFGIDFEDKKLYSTKRDYKCYTSDNLNRIWTHGHCIIGDVTFDSAAYVARYIMTKKTGPHAKYYTDNGIQPEFVRMSRRPGIGASWFQKYQSDIYPFGRMRVRGKITSIPRYYSNLLSISDQLESDIQRGRRNLAAENKMWSDMDKKAPKLSIKEKVKKSQIKSLTRDLD